MRMLSLSVALDRVLASAPSLGVEQVPVGDACGRVLAQAVVAPADLPAMDTSAMDGYAVCSDRCRGDGPFRFPVVGESRAGAPYPLSIDAAACRIFTGAWLPPGSDAVVLQEDVERGPDGIVFAQRPEPLQHVRRRGEDLVAGAHVLSPGIRLNPFHLGLLASVELAEVAVARRPRVALLATGSELRRPGGAATPGSIPESNGVAIAALARQAGAIAVLADSLPDELEPTTQAIRTLLDDCDLLVTIGGVSVGEHDLVKAALERAGVTLDFWKVAIKPGKPLVLGSCRETRVLGLPGNPVSAQVTFCLFALPLLERMQGVQHVLPPRRTLRLTAPIRQSPGRLGLVRVTIAGDTITPLSGQSSGSVGSMAWADGLAIVPEHVSLVDAGQLLEVIAFVDL